MKTEMEVFYKRVKKEEPKNKLLGNTGHYHQGPSTPWLLDNAVVVDG